eukprot:CAMPEP_0113881596 /NCGR_PEP_ID=MMETSP0780_2-20120614/8465_1 /TAXON_ID=652834 /ORGANISM="Palpitomonas bilix" /LENGTH=54 /DNA_ID=CAMNT_0000868473 /DNA_START=78 /DNA_END=245 /DNA_ORIENTATION=- /assembly_acc=CAM_ASM_000599
MGQSSSQQGAEEEGWNNMSDGGDNGGTDGMSGHREKPGGGSGSARKGGKNQRVF